MDEIKTKIISTFNQMYPDAFCELNHRNHFELLVAVILSAQTTDKSVNKITPSLFQKFPTPYALASSEIREIEEEIKTLGLYKTKAKNLFKMAKILVEQYNGIVPSTQKELMTLPGVGQKTANVVMSVAFGKPAFAVDTHVFRVSKRLQIANEEDSVIEVEKKLNAYFPEECWTKLHHQMIFFGRYHCLSRNPKCNSCALKDICRYYKQRNEEMSL